MHTDEAVHAFQFADLLEKGRFRYDPAEYHGPTLIYFTLLPARLRAEKVLSDVDEKTLRLVPVFFGLGLILLLLPLVRGLGRGVVLTSAFWTAVSAPMAFYSRYYIHEVLFVFFSFALIVCGYRFLRSGKTSWILGAAFSAGLMHATKESCVLAWGAMAAALLPVWVERGRKRTDDGKWFRPRHTTVFLGGAAFVSALFYSSFLTHPEGIVDSFRAFLHYFNRSSVSSIHDHPWDYYFRLLLFWHVPGKPVWSEIPMLIPAGIGLLSAFGKFSDPGTDRRLIRFVLCYTALLAAIYTVIPYKTPWNLLGFYHGLVLLAGTGTVALLQGLKRKRARIVSAIFLMVLGSTAIRQTWLLNGRYDSDPGNPWVYAQAGESLLHVIRAVEDVASKVPEQFGIPVEVIVPRHEYWPLPWYFRRFTRIGWYGRVDSTAAPVPVILVAPQEEPSLVLKLYERMPPGSRYLYVPLWNEYTELRPGCEIRGYIRNEYIRKETWDAVQSEKEVPTNAPVTRRP